MEKLSSWTVKLLDCTFRGKHKIKEKAYKEKFCNYKPSAGVNKSSVIKKSRVKKHVEEPLNSFADKTSLVCQLAKLEKESSENFVSNEVLKLVSCQESPQTVRKSGMKGCLQNMLWRIEHSTS